MNLLEVHGGEIEALGEYAIVQEDMDLSWWNLDDVYFQASQDVWHDGDHYILDHFYSGSCTSSGCN